MTSDLAEKAAARLEPIFYMNGWEWNDEGIPTKDRIAETIDYLISTMSELESDSVSTGRISVFRGDWGIEVKLDIASIDEFLQVQDF